MPPPKDDQSKPDSDERLRANMVSLRAALLAMQAKIEYEALMLRLDKARKTDQSGRRLAP